MSTESNSGVCGAMAKAFPEIKKSTMDKVNPHFKSRYASLGNVIDAIKPALAQHELWFVQKIHPTPGYASVETVIFHSSGENFSCGITSVPVSKNDAQGYGSALTYAKRYSLSSAFSTVADEDDDGNEACNAPEETKTTKERPLEKFSPPLPLREIEKLAKRVANELMEDPDLECVIYEKDMTEYLCHWQNTAPLQPALDRLLETNKKKILDSFVRWQTEKAA